MSYVKIKFQDHSAFFDMDDINDRIELSDVNFYAMVYKMRPGDMITIVKGEEPQ